MNVFELFATLGLDSTAYDEGLTASEEKGKSFGKSLGNVLGTGAKVGAAAIAATTTAVVGATAAFAKGMTQVADYGNHIDKASQQMGISAEKYQEWDAILQHTGSSIDSMKMGMRTLANAVETGNEAFERIGLTQEELANMSQEEIFEATISGLQQVEDTTERTYLAGKLLGRGATELGALLNTSAEDTEAMRQRVHELGGVMSDEAVKASATFGDSLQDLQTSFSGLKNNLMSEFLPSITTAMDGLTEIIIGNDSEGLAKVDEGVNNFIDRLNTVMPRVLEVGGRIISSLLTAISRNLPELISQGSGIISEIIGGIIEALPYLMDSAMLIIENIGNALMENAEPLLNTALALILKLVDGFTKNAPTIIPAIVSIVTMIIRTLTQPDTLSALVRAALSLIVALAEGIIAAIPDLIAVIPEVIVNLIIVLVETFPDVVSTVFELLGELGAGILEFIASLMGTSIEEAMAGWSALFEDLAKWGADVLQWFTNIGNSITEKITKLWTDISDFFTNGFENLKEKASSGLEAIKNTFSNIFENVKTTVSNAIEFLKGLFKFDWKLPDIKLPHFSVTGEFNLDPANFSLPKISVDWYAKAMATPYLLDSATIFGASGGKLLGGGESGAEIIYSHDQLMRDIGAAIDSRLAHLEFTIPVYIGGKKIDQQIVTANARNAVISGGR